MAGPESSPQQLAEFVASISACTSEASTAQVTVKLAAEAFGAAAAAIVTGCGVMAAVGYPEGAEPVEELQAIRPGAAGCRLNVPGTGWCAVAAAGLTYPPGAALLIARPRGLTSEDAALLARMARVAAMTMTMLNVLDHERAARAEVERLAREQEALRRVATLIAKGVSPQDIFSAVAREVGNAMPAADHALVARYDPDGSVVVVGGWSRADAPSLVGRRSPLGGHNVSTLVFERNGPARVDTHLVDGTEAISVGARETGVRTSAGAPIRVDRRLWGVMLVASARERALPADTEDRLADFTELAATAIANTQARQEVSALTEEQAALRRVAMLVARDVPPEGVYEAVAEEAGRLLPSDLTLVFRYGDGAAATVGVWTVNGAPLPFHDAPALERGSVVEVVYRTGRPARIEDYADVTGKTGTDARDLGIKSAIGVPICV